VLSYFSRARRSASTLMPRCMAASISVRYFLPSSVCIDSISWSESLLLAGAPAGANGLDMSAGAACAGAGVGAGLSSNKLRWSGKGFALPPPTSLSTSEGGFLGARGLRAWVAEVVGDAGEVVFLVAFLAGVAGLDAGGVGTFFAAFFAAGGAGVGAGTAFAAAFTPLTPFGGPGEGCAGTTGKNDAIGRAIISSKEKALRTIPPTAGVVQRSWSRPAETGVWGCGAAARCQSNGHPSGVYTKIQRDSGVRTRCC